ncbi:FAD-dependent oxidoreductase [Cetobacterium sp. 8H]|uniref:FAD-dependent oxidoreductase n=1 Tax=Cetobacterium sp. 8H TaxID=2759681 RepID=UPI00163B9F52|nr:FAD-dependent oxidoreductase [Cetobacterium sp. 8H]MBC2851750.1 FAD-dependent oxidoreductase [Cetobacterium sp. 8H]
MKKYDAIIIGFGKGGKTLAGFLGNKGYKVALIEKSKEMYGGTCINVGCIPTKILVEESQKFKYKNLLNFESKEVEFKKVIETKDEIISKLREANYNKLNSIQNVDIFNGEGSFETENEIKINYGESSEVIFGDKIFINTGAKTVVPDILGLKDTRNIYDSTSIMNLKTLPKKLAIIGGGYIGLEFASIFNNFGSEVSVIEGNKDILLREEPEVREEIKGDFSKRGINIFSGTKVISIKNNDLDQVEISIEVDGELEVVIFDSVLVAVGRKPNIENLSLENAGINYSDKGIEVNEFLETNVKNIYALGDVKGGLQFTYISLDDFRIVTNQLFGDKTLSTKTRKVIPYSVFISPTLSKVGLSEKEAIENGYDVKTNILKATQIPRAKILQEERGILKVIIEKESDKILGATLYSVESSEVINIIALAIKEGKKSSYLKDFIFTHPTMSEALNDLFLL